MQFSYLKSISYFCYMDHAWLEMHPLLYYDNINGYSRKFQIWEIVLKFLDFFGIFWGIGECFGFFLDFFGGIFLEDFFGRIFLEDFFGRIFWEEFFVYIVKVS